MKLLASLLFTAILTASVAAQENKQPRVRRHPVPNANQSASPEPNPSKALTENITISLGGNFQNLVPMNLKLTGTGPTFQTDIVTKAGEADTPPTIITFQATVLSNSGGYSVKYSLGARIATKTSGSHGPSGQSSFNFQFQDVHLSGSVQLKPNKSVTLSKLNDKELTMTVGPAK
ncbi:hypothetical protein [Haloferula sp.]|uniref:hypothetical protein n=1 Tax=Haloferula sp. TaxID=2497595 RepID=UPI00329D24C4